MTENIKQRVVVAMSGGVDSSVAAAILLEKGYDVIGLSMQLYDHGDSGEKRFDSCCSITDLHDARKVAHKLGFPHYIINYEQEFRDGVIDYFAEEYSKGRTPNPCVMCNGRLKFDHLLVKAKSLGADWVATGHFAKVVHYQDGRPSELYRGYDLTKDQSYFLFSVRKDFLKQALFPLADLSKSEVRAYAKKLGLHTSEKKESQEICFVTSKRYTDFLEREYPHKAVGAGNIVDRDGKVLGQHQGIYRYTVGQRKGLGIRTETPKYVYKIDAEKNEVVVDDLAALATESLRISMMNWLAAPEDILDMDLHLVSRYHGKPIAAEVTPEASGSCIVRLIQPAKWVSPGQAAVLYAGDRVVGGGFIDSAIH
ncbi:MAG: tRNA 2-thiouridine(34) synthase MnmA [Bdellovibrionota bacterium]